MGYDPEQKNPWKGAPGIKPEQFSDPRVTDNPGGMVISTTGEGQNVPDNFLNDPYVQDLLRQKKIQIQNTTLPGGKPQYAFTYPGFNYWENPTNIAMNYNIIRSAPPDWKPPEWMDVDAIKTAYDYMAERNSGMPWYEWQFLPEKDAGTEFLRGMQQPPEQILWGEDAARLLQEKEASRQRSWNELPDWQKWDLSIRASAAQTPDLSDRPLGSRIIGSAVQAAPMFLLGGKLGGYVGKTPGAILGGGLLFGGTFYQGFTGKEAPVIGQALYIFNKGAEIIEQQHGVRLQALGKYGNTFMGKLLTDPMAAMNPINTLLKLAAGDIYNRTAKQGKPLGQSIKETIKNYDDLFGPNTPAEFKELWKNTKGVLQNLPASYEAAKLSYETKNVDLADPTGWLLSKISGEEFKDIPGAVWKYEQGISTPQMPTHGKGYKAIEAARQRIIDLVNQGMPIKEASQQVYAEFNQEYGISGITNDFVLQSVLDPMQFAPLAMNLAGEKIARVRGNERLADTFLATRGDPLIDALPFGIQQLAEGITNRRSTQGIFETFETYKSAIRSGHYRADYTDIPEDMKVKMAELADAGVDGAKVRIDGDTLRWTDTAGKQQEFKASRAARVIPEARDLTDFEKMIGGLDDTYGFKELRPTTGMNWFQKLSSLSPESQTHLMLNTFHGNMAALMDMAHGDVDQMGKLWRQAAGIEKVQPGGMGEQILKSPSMQAIREAIRYAATKDNSLDNMLISWNASKDRRMILEKISKALNEKPKDILTQLEHEPDTLIRRINEVAPQAGDAQAIKDTLSVFTGKDALPWDSREMQAHLVINMADKMDGWFQDHLGLKPNHWVFRLSNAMKGVQSLLLLALNPAYFLNNAINNVVTRAAVGSFGFMTPGQIKNTLDRFGITPPRLDVGVGAADEGAIYGGQSIIGEATQASDLIAKSQERINKVNKAAGVFSRLSGAIEKSESRQATIIGLTTFWNHNWKQGTGFKKMSPFVEAALDREAPGMKQVLYGMVEAGMNIDEIEKSIFAEGYLKPSIGEVVNNVAKTLHPNEPDAVTDLLVKSGILEKLYEDLKDVTDPKQVDEKIWDIRDQVDAFVDAQFQKEIAHRSIEVANIVGKEKLVGVLQLYGDTEIMIGQHWVNSRKAIDDLYLRKSRGEFTTDQWNNEYRRVAASQDKEWRRVYEFETQTLSGIFDSLGIKNERSREFIDLLNQNHENWKTFHEKTRQLRDDYFKNSHRNDKETYDQWRTRTDLAYKTMEDKINEMYRKAADLEEKVQVHMDDEFAASYAEFTGWDIQAARKWRGDIREIRKNTVQAQIDIRRKTSDMSMEDRDRAYVEFNPIYNRMIADMKELENKGIYDLAKQPAPVPEKKVEVPPARPEENPVPTEPDWVQEVPEAEVQGAAANARLQENMTLAREAGAVNKNGQPVQKFALNIVNKYAREFTDPEGNKPYEQVTFTHLSEVPRDVAEYALNRHKVIHEADKVKEIIPAKVAAEDIALIADKQKRMAVIRERGYANRRQVQEYLKKQYNASDLEVAAAMKLMDEHANTLALNTGFAPDEAYRDYWFASRWVVNETGKIIRHIDDGPTLEKIVLPQSKDLGPKLTEFKHNAQAAITKLKELKSGDAIAALFHKDIGDIDLIWGDEGKTQRTGYGLSKILKYHPEVVDSLQDVIGNAQIVSRSKHRIILESSDHTAVLALDWFEEKKTWLLTAYQKNTTALSGTTIDTTGLSQRQGDQARLPQSGDTVNVAQSDNIFNNVRALPKGSINFLKDGRALVRGLNAPDISTMVHETAHIFRRDLSGNDLEIVAKHGGLSGAAELQDLEYKFWHGLATDAEATKYRNFEETHARGFEEYLAKGDAPSLALKSVFRRFQDWMANIYQSLKKFAGRVTGFENQPDFTVNNKTVDIVAKIDGVSLTDIFDRTLTDRPSRPQTWDQVFDTQHETIKNAGRNYQFSDYQIARIAKKEAIKYILGGFTSEADALKFIEDAIDNNLHGRDGKEIHDTAIYDALQEVKDNPDLSPWRDAATVRIMGSKTSAKSIQGNDKYRMTYAVMELEDVIASDVFEGDTIKPNPIYDQAKQPRDRGAQAPREQIEDMAAKLDPEKILDDYKAIDRGAPIIDNENMVLSGNGRTLALSRAIEGYPKKWNEYRVALDDFATDQGIDPETYRNMKHPVLVRVIDEKLNPEQIKQFVMDANTRENLAMSAQEIAVNDVGSISKEAMANLEVGDEDTVEGMLKRAANREFINSFLQNRVPGSEKGQYISKGQYTNALIDRIKNAMFANIYSNDAAKQLLDQFATFNSKSQMKIVEAAMYKVLPQLATLEGQIALGRINPDLSIANDVAIAADRLRWFRGQTEVGSIEEMIHTPPMLDGPLTDTQNFFLRMMGSAKRDKPLRDFIRVYVEEALKEPDPRQPSMFGEVRFRTKDEVMNDAQKRYEAAGGRYEPELSNAEASGEVDAQAAAPTSLVATAPDRRGEAPGTGMVGEELPTVYTEGQPGEPAPAEPQPVEPAVIKDLRSAVAAINKERSYKQLFDDGEAIAIENISRTDLNHTDKRPTPDYIQKYYKDLERMFSDKDQREYAVEYSKWIMQGEYNEPPTASKITLSEMEYVKRHVNEGHLEDLRNEARNNNSPVPMPDSELPPTEGTYIQKVYEFRHGNYEIVAQVYKDDAPVAYYPSHPELLKEFNANGGSARLLGIDPENPVNWVYEIDGAIKKVDPNQAQAERPALLQEGQGDFFTESQDDLPLFSGTPANADDVAFRPQEASPQMSMFGDLVPEAKPTRVVELSIRGNDGTSYIRIDARKVKQIEQTINLHKGEEIKARILDAKGKVLASNVDPEKIIHPSFGDNALFQNGGAYGYNRIEAQARAITKEDAEILARMVMRQGTAQAVRFALMDEPTKEGKILILDAIHKINPDLAESVAKEKEVRATLFQEQPFQGEPGAVEHYREFSDQPLDVQHESEAPMELPRNDAPFGETPLNGVPVTEPFGTTLHEINSEYLRTILDKINIEYQRQMKEGRKFSMGDLSEDTRKEISRYINGSVRNDMAGMKLAAMNYGEQMRDAALLNYSKRYGVDNYLNLVSPYQFWYTRSYYNWAKRMFDRPGWYAMYARIKQMQEKLDEKLPSRLQGKMRIPMPWMPEWMGGGYWIDPMKQIFPFEQFTDTIDQYSKDSAKVGAEAETQVDEMLNAGLINQAEANDAKKNHAGNIWNRALKQAQASLDKNISPASLATMMLSPALWWTIPKNIAQGTPEKISVLPITRTGQAVREIGKDTFAEGLTDIVGGLLAGPEEVIRKANKLSEYGQWGDYYIDRQLANMAGEGLITADQARIAMIERRGAAFDQAKERVATETALRTPGVVGFEALKNDAKWYEILPAFLSGIFGGSLFPTGELKLRGLQDEYSDAWKQFKKGDEGAINNFFADHPEYEARLALFTDPDTRLHEFLVDQVWRKYTSLSNPNKKIARETLGDDFVNAFLDETTSNTDVVNDKTLTQWVQQIGGLVPPTAKVEGITQAQYYNEVIGQAIEKYQKDRNAQFPNWYDLQQKYYSLPKVTDEQKKAYLAQHQELADTYKATQKAYRDGDKEAYSRFWDAQPLDRRKSFLRSNPELSNYWSWNKNFKAQHPELASYFEDQSQKQQTTTMAKLSEAEINQLSNPLIRQLMAYYTTGAPLSAGAWSEIKRIWEIGGKKAPTINEYLDTVISQAFMQ